MDVSDDSAKAGPKERFPSLKQLTDSLSGSSLQEISNMKHASTTLVGPERANDNLCFDGEGMRLWRSPKEEE
jgi:hypothetical protein